MLQRNRYKRDGSPIDGRGFERTLAAPERVALYCISRCSQEARRMQGRNETYRDAALDSCQSDPRLQYLPRTCKTSHSVCK